jgi:amino acid adenylation domain-containing protein
MTSLPHDNVSASADRRALLRLLAADRQAGPAPSLIPRRPILGQAPASFAQRRLWFLDQLAPGNPAYNLAVALRLRFAVDVDAMRRSVQELVRRHEVLRTTFEEIDGEPVQIISPDADVSIPVIDLRDFAPEEREQAAITFAAQEARQPFDLRRGPLFRTKLLRLDDEDLAFVITTHHIISDGVSVGVIGRELEALYPAMFAGQNTPLAPLPIQFGDFAAWQRDWLSGGVLDEQLAYWTRHLSDLSLLQMPTDKPRPPMPSLRGNLCPIRLSADLSDSLRALSRRHRTTLFMTLLAGFQLLLARYTGQDDIVVGAPVAGRNRAELGGLIGFFVNTLVLRTSVAGNPTVRELLARVRETALAAYAHQDLPFEKLVEELHPRRDLSRNPLCQVAFQVLDLATTSPTGAGTLPINKEVSVFDLVITVGQAADGIEGTIEYSTDLFEHQTMVRLAAHYEAVLAGMVESPEQRVWQLPILPRAEYDQIVRTWNETGRTHPVEQTTVELLEAQVRRTPDADAVCYGDERLTYAELNARANQLAAELQLRGVGPDVFVAVALERSVSMVVAVLGVLKAGGAYVPLDPSYPTARLEWMLADTQAPVVVSDTGLRDRLPPLMADVVWLNTEGARIATHSPSDVSSGVTADHLAYVIYTSGSTGQPKGVMVEHRGLSNLVLEQRRLLGQRPDDRVLLFSSFTFDGWIFEVMSALGVGASLHLASRESLLPGQDFVELLRQRAITTVLLPPSALAVMPHADLPALRCLRVAGEACPPHLVARWAPGREIFNLYGPTEATCWSTLADLTKQTDRVHIGRPIGNVEIYILDDHLNPVPIGVIGELHIGGAGVARGYLSQPALTRDRFIPDPFSSRPGARLYKSGDLGRFLPDGRIEFLGRRDHQVKLRGFRIELGEIETAIGGCAGVRQVAVLHREDVPGEPRLVAYVAPHAGHALSRAELQAALRERLPEYMMPAAFVFMEALPVNRSGKIDRGGLPAPESVRPTLDTDYAGARTPVEESLVSIWQDVLGLQAIGIHDNFFNDLGGHSLLATQLVSQVRATFGVELPLYRLFEAPTVAELALHVERSLTVSKSDSVPDPATGEGPRPIAVHELSDVEVDLMLRAMLNGEAAGGSDAAG